MNQVPRADRANPRIAYAFCFVVACFGCGRILGTNFDNLGPIQAEGGAAGAESEPSARLDGATPTVGCSSHQQCIEEALGAAVLCLEQRCVPLTTDRECPVLLGGGQNFVNVHAPEPIVFGVYADLDLSGPRNTVPGLNYELAIDELNDELEGGLDDGPGRPRRPFMAVMCDSTPENLDASLRHLIDEVGVAAILGPQNSWKLISAFDDVGQRSGIFFLNPDTVDTELAELDDDDLVWGLRGTGEQFAPAYATLAERAESFMEERRSGTPDEGAATRVALIVERDPVLRDIAAGLEDELHFNDRDLEANIEEQSFLRLNVQTTSERGEQNYDGIAEALLFFAPHVVIALASGQYSAQVLQELEDAWGSTHPEQVPPFHILAAQFEGDSRLLVPASTVEGLPERMLGLAHAAPVNRDAYETYRMSASSAYNLQQGERYYDAAYYLMYAFAGAGPRTSFTGGDVAQGMRRLIGGGTRFDVGPVDARQVISTLADDTKAILELHGVQGPPNFDESTGVRRLEAGVWCVAPATEESSFDFEHTLMIYEPSRRQFTGSQPCVPDF